MKRLRRHQRDRQIRRTRKICNKRQRRGVVAYHGKRLEQLTLEFVGVMDLVDAGEPTRIQLARLEDVHPPLLKDRVLSLLIDLSAVEQIEPCALLYLSAQLERLFENGRISIRGKYPTAPGPQKLFREAGFQKFLRERNRGNAKVAPSMGHVLQICRGTSYGQLDPARWLPLHAFIEKHGNLNGDDDDAIYNAFNECIENVKQHAFSDEFGGKWYGLAIRPSDELPARAVVVDLGVGITQSVRISAAEGIRRFLVNAISKASALAGLETEQAMQSVLSDDGFCVMMATLGLKKETAEPKRGTGLVGLKNAVAESDSGALHVLSGRGAVSWRAKSSEPRVEVVTPLRGTVVCLEFNTMPTGPDEP